jgi:hypothetical protein
MSWRLNAGNETEVMDARGRNVARAHCGGTYGVNLDEAEAHARLIAAAPDMLAALEWLACYADEDMPSEYRTDSFRSALDAAFEAIAKIKGEA